ncbi:MAG: Sec-independent protein translocase protein TatB [Lysobacteraceae bacterium]
MFDVGFSELLVIAVVALLVLGPERLPKAARFAGLWVRRARAHWNAVKSEFESEIANEDLQRTLRETRAALQNAQEELRGTASELRHQLDDARNQLQALPAAAAATGADGQAPAAHAPVEQAPVQHETAEDELAFDELGLDEHGHEERELEDHEGAERTGPGNGDRPDEHPDHAQPPPHPAAEAPDPQQALPLPPAPPPAGAEPDHDAGR